jgi:hypothetical protein
MASPDALADGEAAGDGGVKKAGNPDFAGVSGLLRIAPDSILVGRGLSNCCRKAAFRGDCRFSIF